MYISNVTCLFCIGRKRILESYKFNRKKGLLLYDYLLKWFQNSKGDASTSMEKFEIDGERNLEVFSGFVSRAKGILTTLIDNIKTNIKDYETKIEDTAKEISDNEISREKCEHEITKMESKIDSIKDAIENVESTYKKMVDAYSSTSKGETKELYSEIIDGAKANCEKDVEKNRSEIARLNSDIEAIKNNISEFTKIIDELNKDLDNFNTELYRFNKALEYLDKVNDKTSEDLEEISNKKEPSVKKAETKTVKKTEPKKTVRKTVIEEDEEDGNEAEIVPIESKRPSVLDTFETETFETKQEAKEPSVDEKIASINDLPLEDALKHIYDLTGYTPSENKKSEETPKKVEPVEQPVYTENLESFFATPTKDVVEEPKKDVSSFLDEEFSNWESILNSPSVGDNSKSEIKPIDDGMEDTANQLLAPYGTSVARLKGLVASEIEYKNGERFPFIMTSEDIIKAVNSVDGNDLKKMKTVGPEITLLRKVKDMKEGNR